jgi:hypothetical protein
MTDISVNKVTLRSKYSPANPNTCPYRIESNGIHLRPDGRAAKTKRQTRDGKQMRVLPFRSDPLVWRLSRGRALCVALGSYFKLTETRKQRLRFGELFLCGLASLIARKFLGVCGQPDTAAVFSDYRNSPNQHVDHEDALSAANRTYYLLTVRLARAGPKMLAMKRVMLRPRGGAAKSTKGAARHCSAASRMCMTAGTASEWCTRRAAITDRQPIAVKVAASGSGRSCNCSTHAGGRNDRDVGG